MLNIDDWHAIFRHCRLFMDRLLYRILFSSTHLKMIFDWISRFTLYGRNFTTAILSASCAQRLAPLIFKHATTTTTSPSRSPLLLFRPPASIYRGSRSFCKFPLSLRCGCFSDIDIIDVTFATLLPLPLFHLKKGKHTPPLQLMFYFSIFTGQVVMPLLRLPLTRHCIASGVYWYFLWRHSRNIIFDYFSASSLCDAHVRRSQPLHIDICFELFQHIGHHHTHSSISRFASAASSFDITWDITCGRYYWYRCWLYFQHFIWAILCARDEFRSRAARYIRLMNLFRATPPALCHWLSRYLSDHQTFISFPLDADFYCPCLARIILISTFLVIKITPGCYHFLWWHIVIEIPLHWMFLDYCWLVLSLATSFPCMQRYMLMILHFWHIYFYIIIIISYISAASPVRQAFVSTYCRHFRRI